MTIMVPENASAIGMRPVINEIRSRSRRPARPRRSHGQPDLEPPLPQYMNKIQTGDPIEVGVLGPRSPAETRAWAGERKMYDQAQALVRISVAKNVTKTIEAEIEAIFAD